MSNNESQYDEARRLARAFAESDELTLCGQFLRLIETRDQARADVRAHEETAKELLRAKDEREKHWWNESRRLAKLIQEYEPKARDFDTGWRAGVKQAAKVADDGDACICAEMIRELLPLLPEGECK